MSYICVLCRTNGQAARRIYKAHIRLPGIAKQKSYGIRLLINLYSLLLLSMSIVLYYSSHPIDELNARQGLGFRV
jgi:hypothetical protein